MVRAGFESDVGGCAVGVVAERRSLFERGDLGVVEMVVEMYTFTENAVAESEDAADGGIGRGKRCGFFGEMQGAAKMRLVDVTKSMQDQTYLSG